MFTYIIRAGSSDLVKIGKADDVEARRRALQTGHPEPLTVLRVVELDVEAIFHERFAENRVRGEWFTFSPEMMTFDPAGWRPPSMVTAQSDEPETFASAIIAALRAEYGIGPRAVRRLADDVGCGIGVAKRWLNGKHPPGGRHLIILMDVSKHVQEAVDRLTRRQERVAAAEVKFHRIINVFLTGADPGPAPGSVA